MYMPTFYRHWKISNFFFWAKCGSFFSSVEQITVNYSVSVSHWFQCGSGLLKIAICLSLNLHEGRPSYRKSLQPSKENIQHFKIYHFFIFSVFVGLFCPPGSGSIRPNLNQCGSGSETLVDLYCCPGERRWAEAGAAPHAGYCWSSSLAHSRRLQEQGLAHRGTSAQVSLSLAHWFLSNVIWSLSFFIYRTLECVFS